MQRSIYINGNLCSTSQERLHALLQDFIGQNPDFVNHDLVTILNGFQTNEDAVLSENDEIFFIPKGVYPDESCLQAMLYARHTPKIQKCLEQAHVAIAGLGGLGSNIAIMLARIGVGHLHLIDFDVVEPSNLNRQQYGIVHLGMKKTDALKHLISQINPYIEVVTSDCTVTAENLVSLFAEDEIVCEAFDTPAAKSMLVTGILSEYPEKYLVAASGMAGYGDSNQIHTRKISDHFYLCGDETTRAQAGCGLMAPRVSICAGHQANAILNLILMIKKEL